MKRYVVPIAAVIGALMITACSASTPSGIDAKVRNAHGSGMHGSPIRVSPMPGMGKPYTTMPNSGMPGTTAPSASSLGANASVADLANYVVCATPAGTCAHEMEFEPGAILVSGDGSIIVASIAWSGWGTSSATGVGMLRLDNCDPSCAGGTVNSYQVTVTVSDPTRYAFADQAYAKMTIEAPGSPFSTHSYNGLVP